MNCDHLDFWELAAVGSMKLILTEIQKSSLHTKVLTFLIKEGGHVRDTQSTIE